MLSGKNIVVTIGNNGTVVALYDSNEIKNKIFLDELNDKTKEQIKAVFTEHKSAQSYLMLDTVDQVYKKKSYPLVTRGDLNRLIKRDMLSDGDKESLKNYIILKRQKPSTKSPQNNKWDCLFVSASNSENLTNWIDFLLEMPNRLVGIFMLPVESFQLLKLLKKEITKPKAKKDNLYCLVIHNKVSGTRQIVFSDQGIVFTRLVDYNFSQENFLERYEQDLYSTFEYLKRLFPDITISELSIINILPPEVIESIKKINSPNLAFTNYTPYEAAVKAGLPKLLPNNSSSCDILISRVFANGQKILKFSTPKISYFDKFFITLKASYFFIAFFALTASLVMILSIFSQSGLRESINSAKNQKITALQEFAKVQQSALEGSKINQTDNGEEIDIERVSDLGKLNQTLGSNHADFIEFYNNLKFIKNYNVKLAKFSYSLNGFNNKLPSANNNYTFSLRGEISNKSGDIEDLFSEFDGLVAKTKERFDKNRVSYTDLPRDIDFNKKYHQFPIDFIISKQ